MAAVSWPSILPQLSGSRVLLRPWAPSDAALRLEAIQDDSILRFTSVPRHPDLSDAQAWVDSSVADAAGGLNAFFVIDVDGSVVGSMGLIDLDQEHATAEIGYWLVPRGRGYGYALEGLLLIRDWALTIGFKRLHLTTNLDNLSSQRVARKAGFQAEGVLRSYGYVRDGSREDVLIFGLVAPGAEASR